MNPMCAAASDNPTTAAEKNSFDCSPRSVNVLFNRNRFGCVARYSGSAPGITSVTDAAVAMANRIAIAICSITKLPYETCVS